LRGQYFLAIKSDVARCLYGFSDAPISARVEVTSEDGNPEVATTIVNENRESGFLTLSADGFHFSSPRISTTFAQAKVVTPAPTLSPTATPSAKPAPSIKTITCTKGKIKKTVKGTSVKCPTGYKKS
jgi:hypothetical protein